MLPDVAIERLARSSLYSFNAALGESQELVHAEPMDAKNIARWLDIGCGEGYYTAQIAQALPQAQGYALDISREAVKRASESGEPNDYQRALGAFDSLPGWQKQRILTVATARAEELIELVSEPGYDS